MPGSPLLAVLCRRARVLGLAGLLAAFGAPPAAAAPLHVPVLAYHQIVQAGEAGGPTRIALPRFEAQMRHLAAQGYATLTLDQLVDFMRGGASPGKAVVLTFDDAWRSQLGALAVLRRHGFRAALFVFPGTGLGDPYGNHLTWAQLAALAADPNIEVQSHSLTHPGQPHDNLATWAEGRTPGRDATDARHEIEASRRVLERRLGVAVRHLAWPGGVYSGQLIAMARGAGYAGLLSIDETRNVRGGDVTRIGRLLVDGACDLDAFRRMLDEHRHMRCASPPRAARSAPR